MVKSFSSVRRWARQFGFRTATILGLSRVSRSEKMGVARSSINIARNNPAIQQKKVGAARRLRERNDNLQHALKNVRDDTPEGRMIIARKRDSLSEQKIWFGIHTRNRKDDIRRIYTKQSRLIAAERALDSLPLSERMRAELWGVLFPFFEREELSIPTKYFGDIVRSNQTVPNEDIPAMQRRSLKMLSPILEGWRAKLFLRRFYQFFHAYTSSGRKSVVRKKN